MSNRQKHGSSNVEYRLTEEEALQLYYSEPRLAALIDLEVIRMIDGCLVVNLRKFITPKTHHLTKTAKTDLSVCCVGVIYDFKNSERLECTLDTLIEASAFLEAGADSDKDQSDAEVNQESLKIDREIDRLNQILNDAPASFSGTLKYHMMRKGYSMELLSQESWVSLSTIKQYRQNEAKNKTLKTVVQLCVGMHLHPWLTEDMIEKAGLRIKRTQPDGSYRYIYTYLYKGDIEDCNKYLRANHQKEFVLREKSA